MRSPQEIAHRLRQEAANVRLLLFPPRPGPLKRPGPLDTLPDPARVASALRGTRFAEQATGVAEQVLRHEFAFLGYTIHTGPEIEWRKDYIHGHTTDPRYFRLVPYLDFSRAGDHKVIWELSRHQHLVTLAMAWRFTGKREYLDEIERQLASWTAQNPFQRGIHWTSALEAAFRALSWIWIWHLASEALSDQCRETLWSGLARHGAHLAVNLSFYFSPNTHLLGEAVALHAIGRLFPELPQAAEWREFGRSVVATQMERQVRADGSHFEQSSYYHVYALDMMQFHALLEPETTTDYKEKLARMGEYLHALLGPDRRLPLLGDDDGGRLFHPYGERDQFGRASLATTALHLDRKGWAYESTDLHEQASWWLGAFEGRQGGEWASRLFPDSGVAVLHAPGRHITIDAGPFGRGRAGHSHSDTLSMTVSVDGQEVLIDPGTYTYISDPSWRDAFRGSEAHNTIRVNRQNQGRRMGPFWWADPPEVRILEWSPGRDEDVLEAECISRGVRHGRRVRFRKPDLLEIVDEITGPEGEYEAEYLVEQFWHGGSEEQLRRIEVDGPFEQTSGWRSRVFGVKEEAPVLRVFRSGSLPVKLHTRIDLSTQTGR